MTNMCTAEDVQTIIHAELDKRGADFVRKFWYIIIGFAISTAGAWYSLYYQVQRLDLQQADTTVRIKDSVAENQRQIDVLRGDYKEDIGEIKDDLKYIRERI